MLNQENFDRLLEWLHPDREEAGRKYKIIHTRLIKFFMCRGCAQAEEMADDTINRVCRKAKEIVPAMRATPRSTSMASPRKYISSTHTKTPLPPKPSRHLLLL
jgi:hypothetical protein